mgnify:CR=1 FL=1
MEKDIIIKGAREHNLKNIDVKNTTRKSLSYLQGFRAPVNHLWRLIQFMQRDKEDM